MSRCLAIIGLALALPAAVAAEQGQGASEPALTWSLEYTADVIGPISGGVRRGVVLDDLSLTGTLDLERAFGVQGARIVGYVLNNSGAIPNDHVGSLEGVDNIEVGAQRARLFELYYEQGYARGLSRVGLMDLNAEFYATEASGLLIGPTYGIGSELAATGPNGPSIFPSSALGVMGKVTRGEAGYVQAAAFNAAANSPGDPGGVDTSFDEGALVIAEAGLNVSGKLALGAWAYTRKQDDVADVDPSGNPVQRRPWGVYALAERRLGGHEASRMTTGFLRLGASDGDTGIFAGSLSTGLRVERMAPGRPDSQFSVGARFGRISDKTQSLLALGGLNPAEGEAGLELTYSDTVSPWLRVQPNLQAVWNAGGDRDADAVVVAGLRLAIAFARE